MQTSISVQCTLSCPDLQEFIQYDPISAYCRKRWIIVNKLCYAKLICHNEVALPTLLLHLSHGSFLGIAPDQPSYHHSWSLY